MFMFHRILNLVTMMYQEEDGLTVCSYIRKPDRDRMREAAAERERRRREEEEESESESESEAESEERRNNGVDQAKSNKGGNRKTTSPKGGGKSNNAPASGIKNTNTTTQRGEETGGRVGGPSAPNASQPEGEAANAAVGRGAGAARE
ncbi:unnamed protein product [Amoebophrya sp. A120]|nr:unnamed protein product [Amoebophrya sp. A120]|eukprot:GSA120T00007052001.1